MKTLDWDIWLEKYGEDYGEQIIDWLETRPVNISLKSLGIRDIDDFVMEQLHDAYGDYLSKCEDRAYDEFRDEELKCL